MINNKPELVAPAGEWSSLKSALDAGADGVYFGVKGLNMRNRARNFDLLELGKVMEMVHSKGKKGYLSLNVIIFNHEIDKVRKILEEARDKGVDAVVLWDMAVLKTAKDLGLNVHLSTQASVSNIESLRFYSSLGVKRIVLARECALEDTAAMIMALEKEGSKCEIETFVHGAMCVSVSGRCFLSHHSFNKSANRGECMQPCRREFLISDFDDKISYIVGKDYVLSPKDLCAVGIIDRLVSCGIHAFKIEGRLRSPEYVRETTSVYREAIDACFEGALDDKLKAELFTRLKKIYNRGFTSGFYMEAPDEWVSGKLENEYEKVYVGEVVDFYGKIGVAKVFVRSHPLRKGEEILVSGRTTPAQFAVVTELEKEHKAVDSASRGEEVAIKLPFKVRPRDKVYLWKTRSS